MQRKLTDSEVATVLCALRSMQQEAMCRGSRECDHFDDAKPLSASAIDTLCEDINLDCVTLDVQDGGK